MKKIILAVLVCVAVYGFIQSPLFVTVKSTFQTDKVVEQSNSDRVLEHAFKRQLSDIQVGGSGKVIKLLRDDTQGSRHQKFIVKLASGQTILIAHNIDLAPRIHSLSVGDPVNFYGEYEWNVRGGVVHWTHHDPGGRHEGGWINHGGTLYE
ncbi:DUF3465 domain-containing protein [Desulfoluna sp.]|uniref:DUF3465 domain-containing protein n=1 Tax=Desulfoluna sp. TaxID=2045199 RepID=UPI00263565C9|nr:DUF3465 domain-containing protein [Desulfoluna sp.]